MKERVERVIERIRPAIRQDGGDLELVGVEGGIVTLRLTGSCNACDSKTAALLRGIERAIQVDVPDITRVELLKK
ncbi:MAG TPA: NifU family protein [bacterium]